MVIVRKQRPGFNLLPILAILSLITLPHNISGQSGISNTTRRIGKTLGNISDQILTTGLVINKRFFSNPFIHPGTRWCGSGDRAKSSDDLGLFKETDECCHAHDKCQLSIAPKKTMFNLENTGLFTRSHCDCDDEFYQCLKNSNEIVSGKIGVTYFNILGPQCFREDYPIIRCNETVPFHLVKTKCVKYHLNATSNKIYQWFDNPLF